MIFSRARCVSHLFSMAIFLSLFVSGASLNYIGLNYSGDDAASGVKIHPYVILTAASLFVLFWSNSSRNVMLSNRMSRRSIVFSIIIIFILIIKFQSGARQSLGFAVDTLVSALWAAAVVPFLSEKFATRIWRMGFVFVVIECAIAAAEVVAKYQFIPIDTWYGSYFRATALHGHPLNNALVLLSVVFSLQLSASRRISVFLFLISTIALTAFGARGALAVYLTTNCLMFVRFGLRSSGRLSVVLFSSPIILIVLGWLLLSGALGDRIANVGAYDDSSDVRLHSIKMMEDLNWGNLLIGVDPDRVIEIMKNANVGVVENFLIAYVFLFGVVCTIIIFYCFWVIVQCLARVGEVESKETVYAIFLVFFLVAITNNSLATKTPALYLCIVFAWVAGRVKKVRKLKVNHKVI
ncbi:VpsF family polysaccharide biosynthesis protein [Paraburkholderia sp. J94]|uniref:VpsF family polysaccharide biosynthesis protein n=1 Tax=Paraburkholderia sp. J94 TaxID=2805441 RepID=UPI002AAF40C7|nr:VpsF family polysaccharide biosynthesis protein [Paraburkholderia sp. J94]